jgi:hypothetical protein
MKTKCPNGCPSKCRQLLTGIYLCSGCKRIFAVNSETLYILNQGKSAMVSSIPKIAAPLKLSMRDKPTIFINIGKNGISQKMLHKKISKLNEIPAYKKNSILKVLDLGKIDRIK